MVARDIFISLGLFLLPLGVVNAGGGNSIDCKIELYEAFDEFISTDSTRDFADLVTTHKQEVWINRQENSKLPSLDFLRAINFIDHATSFCAYGVGYVKAVMSGKERSYLIVVSYVREGGHWKISDLSFIEDEKEILKYIKE